MNQKEIYELVNQNRKDKIVGTTKNNITISLRGSSIDKTKEFLNQVLEESTETQYYQYISGFYLNNEESIIGIDCALMYFNNPIVKEDQGFNYQVQETDRLNICYICGQFVTEDFYVEESINTIYEVIGDIIKADHAYYVDIEHINKYNKLVNASNILKEFDIDTLEVENQLSELLTQIRDNFSCY